MKLKGTFIAGALAFRLPMGQYWEVYCNECSKEIGKMSSDILVSAIMNTAGRGGVKCPSCRDKTCDYCGLTLDAKKIYTFKNKEGNNRRICHLCILEFASEERIELRPSV